MRKRVMVSLVVIGLACAGASRVVHAQQCDDGKSCTANDMCSDGLCTGTPQSGGGCNDGNECTTNDTCQPDGSCRGTNASVGTSCEHGCGTCQEVAPLPEIPLICGGDIGDAGKPCDVGIPCFTGSCQIIDTGGAGFNPAFCTPAQKVCPDTDGNPCTDNCNFQTGQCEKNAPKCNPVCETCNQSTGVCQPANIGGACDDSDVCSPQSRCEVVDFGPRGICRPGEPTVTSGTPTPTATPVGATATATATHPPVTPTATLPLATATVTATRPPVTPPTPGPCVGDCNDNTMVDVIEVRTGVEIALGSADVSACPAFEVGAPGVTIEDLVQGVNSKINGCI